MPQKRALHINTYFLSNRIHYHLYNCLLKKRKDQFLLPAHKSLFNRHIPEVVELDYTFSKMDMVLFMPKIWKTVRLFYKKDFKPFDYLHAHSLIGNGLPALILSKRTNKDYVVSVRSADFILFINRSFIFKIIARKVLHRAKLVFYISPSLKEKVEKLFPEVPKEKLHPLPNGLDPYWINEGQKDRVQIDVSRPLKLLFVGQISPLKNLDVLFEFMRRQQPWPCTLTVVGENTMNLDFEKINKTLPPRNTIVYLGKVGRKELKDIYDDNDIFVLLSHNETFGVVYTEAMSRGLPIIYTAGQGVDGFFEEGEVGFSCNPTSVDELHKRIAEIIPNYQTISQNARKKALAFNWDDIVDNYIQTIEREL